MKNLLLCCLLLPVPASGAQDVDDFSQGLQAVHELMERRSWNEARNELDTLLERHAERDYVAVRLAGISEDVKRCMFWSSRSEPHWRKLVSGRLSAFSPRTGSLNLRYVPDTLDDFFEPEERSRGRRFRPGERLLHPVNFKGSYRIEIDGTSYPNLAEDENPTAWVCVDGDEAYAVLFGMAPTKTPAGTISVPAAIVHIQGSTQERVTEIDRPPVVPSEAYRLEVRVSTSEISVAYNGRVYMRTRKSKELFGRAGFENFGEFESLTLAGSAQSAWLRGLADSAFRREWEAFERSFQPEKHLPAWLINLGAQQAAAAAPEPELELSPQRRPGDRTGTILESFAALRQAQRSQKALEFALGLDEGAVEPSLRQFLIAQAHFDLRQYPQALEHSQRAQELDARLAEPHILEARSLRRMHRTPAAIAAYRELIDGGLQHASAFEELAQLHLLAGNPRDAQSVVDEARLASITSRRLEEIASILVKAIRGPEWARVYRYESRHYEVLSDIDRSVCRETARTLEDNLRQLQLRLGSINGLEQRKFRVYVFSGEASYRAYAWEVFRANGRDTAGLYSPDLKQLLIWTPPQERNLTRTTRHEGFHQFIDRLMVEPPTWLNEGLAEYYAAAPTRRSQGIGEDDVYEDHMRILKDPEVQRLPLSTLIELSPPAFYAKPNLHYAQAWSWIYFLRHSTRQNERLFQSLFGALLERHGAPQAQREIFQDVDFEALERDYERFISAL